MVDWMTEQLSKAQNCNAEPCSQDIITQDRQRQELISMYPELFDDTVGCFDYQYYNIHDPNVQPVVHPPRHVTLEL